MTDKKHFEQLDEALAWMLAPSLEDMKPGLDRTFALLERLGNPQDNLRIVHIAGTNGKGSTSTLLGQVYIEAGFKVGLYTSPELNAFNERIRINNQPIPDEDLLQGINQLADLSQDFEDQPSQFELSTALALQYFEDQGCDLVILETGLGGRLDSTNVVQKPLATIITPISYDHTGILGSTLSDIAQEKAGILKDGVPLVLAPQDEEALKVLHREAGRHMAPIYAVDMDRLEKLEITENGQRFSYRTSLGRLYEDQELNLLGDFQLVNAATVLESIDALADHLPSPREVIRAAFKKVTMQGRFEVLQKNPLWIADVAHNPQGISALVDSVKTYFPKRKVSLLFVVFADKEVEKMLKLLAPIVEDYTVFHLDHKRALDRDKLVDYIEAMDPGKGIYIYDSLDDAVKHLQTDRSEDSLILSCGSLSFMGPLRSLVLGETVAGCQDV